MQIKIKRGDEFKAYKIEKAKLLLEALLEIKHNIDYTLAFDYGCKSKVCGTCAVRVNGKETLACAHRIKDGDEVEPLRYEKHLKDLKVEQANIQKIAQTQGYLHEFGEYTMDAKDEAKNDIQSDCILCSSCFSACPVLEVNQNFIGPYALTRAYRYVVDKREANAKSIIEAVQKDGIWDCTLCGECSLVCPKGIDPKSDIMQLRNISAQHGFFDPNFANNFGGFDPNFSF